MDETTEVADKDSLSIDRVRSRILYLEKKSKGILQSIDEQYKELIRTRFKQGKIISQFAAASEYGDNALSRLADTKGISETVLYEAKRFYEHPDMPGTISELNGWLSKWDRITWTDCRDLIRDRRNSKTKKTSGSNGRVKRGRPPKEEKTTLVRRLEAALEAARNGYEGRAIRYLRQIIYEYDE